MLSDQWFLPNPQFQVSATIRPQLCCEGWENIVLLFPAFIDKALTFCGWKGAQETKTSRSTRQWTAGVILWYHHLCSHRVHPPVPAGPWPTAHLMQSQVVVVFKKPFLDKTSHADYTRLFWEGASQFCPSSAEGEKLQLPRSWGPQQLCSLFEEKHLGRVKYWFCTSYLSQSQFHILELNIHNSVTLLPLWHGNNHVTTQHWSTKWFGTLSLTANVLEKGERNPRMNRCRII